MTLHMSCNIYTVELIILGGAYTSVRWKEEFFLYSVVNTTSGIDIHFNKLKDSSSSWTYPFSGLYLPPECNVFPCGRLGSDAIEGNTVSLEGTNVTQFELIVPVVRGLVLLDVRVNESGMISLWNFTVINASFHQCNPVSFASHIRYIICAYPSIPSSVSFRLLELRTTYNNRSEMQQAWLASTEVELRSLSGMPEFFQVKFENEPFQCLIGLNGLYKFSPWTNSIDLLDNTPNNIRMTRIEGITPPSETVLIYGEESCYYFDVGDESVVDSVIHYNISGYPVICSMDPSTQLNIIININETTLVAVKGIMGQNSTSSQHTVLLGEKPILETVQCLGSKHKLYLAYVDTDQRLFVLDLSSGHFLPQIQLRGIVQPPIVLNNRFLVILLISNHTSPTHNQGVSIVVFDAIQFNGTQVETVTSMYTNVGTVSLLKRRYSVLATSPTHPPNAHPQTATGTIIGSITVTAVALLVLSALFVIIMIKYK